MELSAEVSDEGDLLEAKSVSQACSDVGLE